MAVGRDAHVFLGFLTPVLTQLFFQKPPTTCFTCFSRDERRKYAGKKVLLNLGLCDKRVKRFQALSKVTNFRLSHICIGQID